MKVTAVVYVQLQLEEFEFPGEVYDQIGKEIGVVSPARMLSEYIFRQLKEDGWSPTQVSALPEKWEE